MESEDGMSGRTRETVAFLTVTALGCSGVTQPGDAWSAIAFLWVAAIPLTVTYACALIPRRASY